MKKNKIRLALVNFWQYPAQTPHFGLTSLAAYIRKEISDIEIGIIEGADPLKDIVNFNPDVIGFTSDTFAYTKTLKQVKILRKKFKKTPFILGGVHITAMPESLDQSFDLGVVGEGEITFKELLELFKERGNFPKKSLKKIKGLIYHNRDKIMKTEKREQIKNIDELPYPARDLTPMNEYYLKDQLNLFGVKRLATLMTSRGCPYHCVYCGSPAQWGGVRFHSPEYVIGEIKMLLEEYKVDGIMFWDDLFIASEERVEKMVSLIKKEGLDKKLTFFGYARANLINERICRVLKKMNVKRLIFGFETGSERILGYLKKYSVTVADNRRTVKLCRKYGIITSSGFITGTPGETITDLKKTYDFMKKYPLDNTQIYFLTPFPGVETWRLAEKEGLVSNEMDFSKLFVQLPLLRLSDFFRKENPSLIKNRIFLNTKYKNSKEYLGLIFKMQKLAFWQNFLFYRKVVFTDFSLIMRIINSKVKELFLHLNNGKKRPYPNVQFTNDTKEVLKRVEDMFDCLSKGCKEVQPSKLWQDLINRNFKELNQFGYENFKRTLVRHYFAYVPLYLMNTQILFLITHLSPITTITALYKSLVMPTHYGFNWIDSASFNFITYLLWFYTEKVDKDKLLVGFKEPSLGNPPKIFYKNKLISQDIANSILEFKSIFDKNVSKNDIRTVADLGAGCGRDAVVFVRLLPNLKKYLVIDIPPALVIAEKYLSELFPQEKIFNFRPFNSFSEIKEEFEKSKILFFLPNQIELLPNNIIDLFINISSLHEMRLDQIKYYFRQIERLTKPKGYFYFKEFKDSYVAFEDVHIRTEDYPLYPKWDLVYLRESKVQIKFFEALARLKKK